jgi:chromosome segregation ATPase
MKERVAATEAVLSAAAQEGHQRNARLVKFLENVENNLVQKTQQISDLEEEQSRSREEIERLRNMLDNVLTLAETSLERSPRPAPDNLEQLIDRLNAITSTMDPDDPEDEEAQCDANSAQEPDPAPVRERRVSKVFALFSSAHK